jgi:Na+/melibiose symporter-like transporter
MRLSIFRVRSLAVADLTLLLTAAAVFGTFYFVSLYLQQILGYRPLSAGAAFLPLSAGIATGATVARKLIPCLGVRVVPVIGLAIATAGMVVLTHVPVHGRYASNLLPGLLRGCPARRGTSRRRSWCDGCTVRVIAASSFAA